MEQIALLFSGIAIFISVVSLIWAIHIGRRDRGNIKTASKIIETKHGKYLHVKVVNQGRRPVILTILGIDFSNTSIMQACGEKSILRLDENELFEQDITDDLRYIIHDDGHVEPALDIWVEDTLGRRYKIEGAKEYLRSLCKK